MLFELEPPRNADDDDDDPPALLLPPKLECCVNVAVWRGSSAEAILLADEVIELKIDPAVVPVPEPDPDACLDEPGGVPGVEVEVKVDDDFDFGCATPGLW